MATSLIISGLNICLFIILSSSVNGTPHDFDCPMRQFLVEYSAEVNPTLTQQQLQQIADALNGTPRAKWYGCNVHPPTSSNNTSTTKNIDLFDFDESINTIYVDVKNGDDDRNNGLSISSPFKTIQKAIYWARKLYGPHIFKQILLREGTYYLGSTIYLNELDSNLLLTSYGSEYVNISGAVPLNNLKWTRYGTKNGHPIYRSTVSNMNISDIYGLRINGYRGIRARYPNVESEETFPPETYSAYPSGWNTRTGKFASQYVYNVSQFVRNDTNPVVDFMPGGYQYYRLEIGGDWFNKFTPPGSPPRFSQTYITGLNYNKQVLPNSPYRNLTGGIIRGFMQLHWNSWMWYIDHVRSNQHQLTFINGGGMQGSQGGTGDTFFIENVFEELDAPNEWFYDTAERVLYFVPNNTAHFENDKYDAVQLKVLFEYEGNQTHPVKNISIDGVAIIDTAYSFMDDHGVPSAGDWAFQYNGAINLVGTENCIINNCLFERLDGNAIFLFDYNRNATITYNEFAWIGDSCIAAWGNTEGYQFHPPPNGRYAKLGPNGTAGNQPRFSNVSYNFAREIGINEKQAAFYFQAVACQNYIGHNVIFNGPRAGINFNDGFGGSNVVESNVAFNLCRESSDHGPFNSWDRVPYITKVRTGQESIIRAWDHVKNNLFISNYGATYQIDNDDVSQYYRSYNNFLVYGDNAFKSNYGGHDINHWNNIYAYVGLCMQLYDTTPYPQNKNIMINNTCIVNATVTNGVLFNYAFIGPNFDTPDCTTYYPVNDGGWEAHNNTIMINRGNADNTGYCQVSIRELQKHGTEIGSTVSGWPETSEILAQAKAMLSAA